MVRSTGFVVAVCIALGMQGALAKEYPVIFEEKFKDQLDEGWTWLRENADDWRLADGALEIRARPGDAESVRNALLRPAPSFDGRALAFEVTVTFTTELTEQYEQAGLVWYNGGKPVFKLVHERVDGELVMIPGHIPTKKTTVDLRLVVDNGKYTAQFREVGETEFRTLSEGDLAVDAQPHISIQSYHGPAQGDHWMRFTGFRIVRLDE